MEIDDVCYLTCLSQELLCNILSFLPLKNILLIGTLNKTLFAAVKCYLHLIKDIDFCEGKIISHLSTAITDRSFKRLLHSCPNLEVIRGLHIPNLFRTRSRKTNGLSIPGIVESLLACPKLRKIETSNFILLEIFSQKFPAIELEGIFQNRDGIFPPKVNQQIRLSPFLRITSLHLIGVQVVELPKMSELQELHLRWIQFTRLHPFRGFSATKLRSFVLKQCLGPSFPLRYYPVFVALGLAPELARLEIVRIPVLGGMIFRAVEEGLRYGGFRKMKKLIIADCKGIMESDFGQLMIASGDSLETVYIQGTLTKDSLFASLLHAHCSFYNVKTLHLGFVDRFLPSEQFSEVALVNMGMASLPDVPASITDSGLRTVSQLFPNVQNITISNCPHIINAKDWSCIVDNMWKNVTCLTLDRCHCLRLAPLASFLTSLEKIEVLTISNMFREPPKGCSHVGLSAGTGLGLSSVIVSNQDEHIAVQGHHNDAVPDNEIRNAAGERIYANGDDHVVQPNYIIPQPGSSRLHGDLAQHDRLRRHCMTFGCHGRRVSFDAQGNRIDSETCHCNETDEKPKKTRKLPFGKRRRTKIFRNNYLPKSCVPCDKGKISSSSACASSSKRPTKTPGGKKSQKPSSKQLYTGPMTRCRSRSKYKDTCGYYDPKSDKRTYACSSSDSSKNSTPRKRSKKEIRIDSSDDSDDSDNPFFEKDITLVFNVTSQSLINLSVISCGISDIVFEHCPNLLYVQTSGCRILKEFKFTETQSVMKINIDHCPKIRLSHFVPEIMNIYSSNRLLVCLEPLARDRNCSISALEEYVFTCANSNHSVVVLEKKDEDGAHYERSLLHWFQFIEDVYRRLTVDYLEKQDLLFSPEVVSYSLRELVSVTDEDKSIYPWGHNLSRIIGQFEFGGYELLTNNPLFAIMWRKFINHMEDNQVTNSDLEYFSKTEIPEIVEANVPLGKYQVCFLCHL